MKKMCFFFTLLVFSLASLLAQHADKLTDLIQSPAATNAQVAYIVAVYQNKIPETATYQQAFAALVQDGFFSATAKADAPINLADASYIIASATGIKGGLFYTLFPCPRYAYRELKAKEILPQYTDAHMLVAGRDIIALLNGCIAEAEGAQR